MTFDIGSVGPRRLQPTILTLRIIEALSTVTAGSAQTWLQQRVCNSLAENRDPLAALRRTSRNIQTFYLDQGKQRKTGYIVSYARPTPPNPQYFMNRTIREFYLIPFATALLCQRSSWCPRYFTPSLHSQRVCDTIISLCSYIYCPYRAILINRFICEPQLM
jgi:hypothetical protein